MEFSNLIEQLTSDVDPVTIAIELKRHSIISGSSYEYILRLFGQGRERRDIWYSLTNLIIQGVHIKAVLNILENAGYASIAIKLLLQYLLSQQCLPSVKRLEATSRRSQKLFVNLKINTHNNIFKDPRIFLRDLSSRYKKKFKNETNGYLKTRYADSYAAVLCAEIDSHTMLYKKEFPKHGLFNELKSIASHTSDFHVTNVAYSARMGIAYAIAEDMEKADDYMKDARVSSYNIEQCVGMDNMLYIQVFNLLCEYEKCPTEDLRRQILEIAEMGLQCLQYDEDEIRSFWKPMFFLRIIYCYLGLSNKGDPIPTAFVSKTCIEKSKKLLGDIDSSWEHMKTRRKMFYYAARARINELEDNIDAAVAYLENAIQIGTAGEFGELSYITAYWSKLKGKTGNCLNRSTSFVPSPLVTPATNTRHSINENESTVQHVGAAIDPSPMNSIMLNQDLPDINVVSLLLPESEMPSDLSVMGMPVCAPEVITVDEFNFSSELTPVFDHPPESSRLDLNGPSSVSAVFPDSSPQEMLFLN